MNKIIDRNRALYVFVIVIVIVLGLLSRKSFVPSACYPYLGDILYALMVYFIVAFIGKNLRPIRVALIAILICYTVELSQLYQAEWINTIRNYRLGGLILGYGFLWQDLINYLIGTGLGLLVEYLIFKIKTP